MRIVICDSVGIIVKWGHISVDWGCWASIGGCVVGKGGTSDKDKDSKLKKIEVLMSGVKDIEFKSIS